MLNSSTDFRATKPTLYVSTSPHGSIVFDPQHNRFLNVNDTALEMWRHLAAGLSGCQVTNLMAERYGVATSVVAEDIRSLLHQMSGLGVTAPQCALLIDSTATADPDITQQLPTFPWYAQDASNLGPIPKRSLVITALFALALFDLVLSLLSFATLCKLVKNWQTKNRARIDTPAIMREICSAVDRACVWYPKRALCLQRSAVTTCLLRSHGVSARLVIGVHTMPFLAHAWVEAEGAVINDFPRVRCFYPSLTSY